MKMEAVFHSETYFLLATRCHPGSSSLLERDVQQDVKSEANPVTDRGGPGMLTIPRFLDNRLTDVAEVVSLTHLPHSTRQKHHLCFLIIMLVAE
jgi:hypothetical protein